MRPSHPRRVACTCALLTLLGGGCYRRVNYVSPNGRRVEIVNVGFDTRIGSLSAETPTGSLRLDGVESRAGSAARLAELSAALARELAPKGGAR